MKLLQSKKSQLFLLIFTVSVFAVFLKVATFQEFSEFIKWVFSAYVVGNGAEHHANKDKPN